MAKDIQVKEEIRKTPEFVTSIQFKQQEERLNGWLYQAFTDLTATLSSTIIIHLAGKSSTNQPFPSA
jgi:hypothetical protein